MIRAICGFALITLVGSGCASVEITKVTPENPYKDGVRFYRPAPYLWVTKNKEGSLQGSIVYLPNTDEEYVIRVKSGFGSVDTKYTLENGWNLVGFNETSESKTADIITALTGSLSGIKGVLRSMSKETLRPGLYIFVFDEKTGMVRDLQPVLQFE
jgi:hypothetical protein